MRCIKNIQDGIFLEIYKVKQHETRFSVVVVMISAYLGIETVWIEAAYTLTDRHWVQTRADGTRIRQP